MKMRLRFERAPFNTDYNEKPTDFVVSTQDFYDENCQFDHVSLPRIINVMTDALNSLKKIKDSNELFCIVEADVQHFFPIIKGGRGVSMYVKAEITSVVTQEHLLLYSK